MTAARSVRRALYKYIIIVEANEEFLIGFAVLRWHKIISENSQKLVENICRNLQKDRVCNNNIIMMQHKVLSSNRHRKMPAKKLLIKGHFGWL